MEGDNVRAFDVAGHCFYFTANGQCLPGYSNWEGQQTASEGDRIGMLLDLDQGSMSIWKNGERLGVMQAEGLAGPLCWAASTFQVGNSARVESAAVPAPPTQEDLAAAAAWQRRDRLDLPQTATDAECAAAEAAPQQQEYY